MPTLFQDLLSTLTLRERRRRHARLPPASPQQLESECERVLATSKGEPGSIALASTIFDYYATLDSDGRAEFFRRLQTRFGPVRADIEAAYARYREQDDDAALQQLFNACEPPRQELLRRLNLAPEGTPELVHMREDLLPLVKQEPELATVDRDFRHLFDSWFNRGFLVLRRIDWHTPAAVLEKLIEYEAVHTIRGWDDLRRRLDPRDRRCYAFFHPALGDEPLIFVEVALADERPASIQAILHAEQGDIEPHQATTAAFFGISNCQYGLHGISLGNFLLKQVVQELKHELPNLRSFVTMSPVPGIGAWLGRLRRGEVTGPVVSEQAQTTLQQLDAPGWHEAVADPKALREAVLPLAAWYLVEARDSRGLPLNPVARFHLRNGARLEHINWLGDVSAKGLEDGLGLVVNYAYDLAHIDRNYERLIHDGDVVTTSTIRRLARQANDHRHAPKQGATS